MKIYKRQNKVICELDFWQHKNNCYDPEEEKELTHNLIGIIAGDECSISQLNDLSYKDDQQEGMPIIQTWMEKDEFRKLCQELGIDCWEHPICSKCGKVIYGCFTGNKKYDKLCFDCEMELEKKK